MSEDRAATFRFRVRLLASCVVLVGLAMAQSPGLLAADTKFDLAVDPAGFLRRALHLWDALGALGQLQNQAYGYLWPMGPFFLLGSVLDVPGWVVQRLWLALVMCVAFTGAAKLTRTLGVRSDLACVLAGFAFALSPRMLTTLGPISIEAWPSAMAPWVLLPLVIGSRRGSPRRAAAWSAVAVAMVGGVNAAATFAVIPLGVVWVLTRTAGPRRRALMVWWPVFTVLGTLWWLIPLALMGAYSPPFLDFIESASNTTFSTDLVDALRGTSNWVPYVGGDARAGRDLISEFYLPLNSGVVLFLGLVGLLLRRNRERLFLALSVLLGLAMVGFGHVGAVQGWAAEDLRTLLDGVLAPLRNVHKFDPVIRLPLVIGLAWTVDAVMGELRSRQSSASGLSAGVARVQRLNQYAVVGTALIAVFGASLPAVQGRITPAGAAQDVPGYWRQTADWLAGQDGSALLVPGSSFGTYLWGAPQDEPMQALARSPWAVRNAVPLTPPGTIRMLDAIQRRFAQGQGSPGLAAYLRRAGITHLVVRNDLERSADIADPVLVHQALAESPGLERVRAFGPEVGGAGHLEGEDDTRIVINGGWQTTYRAVEIYAVAGGRESGTVSGGTVPVVVGGPEDLLDLEDLGILDGEPTVLANDVSRRRGEGALVPGAQSPLVLTDGQRDVERNFGRLDDGSSATREPGDPRRLGNPTRDYLLDDAARWSTTARIDGVRRLRASSSMADASAYGVVQPGALPFAAADGDPDTAWMANYDADHPAWWQADLETPRWVESVSVTAGPTEREVVRVRTDHATTDAVRVQPGRTVRIDVGDRATGSVRVEDASGRAGNRMTLAEVAIPGVVARRTLVLPATPARWGDPERIVLRAVADARSGCAEVDRSVRCAPGREVAGEEPAGFRRSFELAEARTYSASVRAVPRSGSALENLITKDLPVSITASSAGVPDVRASGLAAIDGDPGTTWTASPGDLMPTLRLNWIGQRRLRYLDLRVAADASARVPTEVELRWPGGRRTVTLDDGTATFPALRTDQLTIRVLEAEPATDLGFDSAATQPPVGISELRLGGVGYVPVVIPDREVDRPCGSGPTLRVPGRVVATAVSASPAQLYAGGPVAARACGSESVDLRAGTTDLEASPSPAFAPSSVVLSSDSTWSSWTNPAQSRDDGPVRTRVTPAADDAVLALPRNVNPGWEATQDGRRLSAVTVDGWRQGYRLRSADPVRAAFAPDAGYRVGLGVGALCLLLLLVLAGWWSRRWDGSAPPLGPARAPAGLLGAIALLAGGVLAGWWGLAVAAAAFAVAAVAVRRSPASGPWLVALLLFPAVLAFVLRPWGSADGWAGALGWPPYLVVALGAVLLGWLCPPLLSPLPPMRRLRSRWAGSSTSR